MVQLNTNQRSTSRSTKPARIICTAGNGADGNWVEETTLPSIGQQAYGYNPFQGQLILQQEVDEDKDATVLMKDDGELDTYSQEADEENDDTTVEMKTDDEQLHTYSQEVDMRMVMPSWSWKMMIG